MLKQRHRLNSKEYGEGIYRFEMGRNMDTKSECFKLYIISYILNQSSSIKLGENIIENPPTPLLLL
jgi:hypothetical protein